MGGCYIFMGSNLEKYGKFWKNGRFSRRIWPDWGNAAWADMAGLGVHRVKPNQLINVPLIYMWTETKLLTYFSIIKIYKFFSLSS